MTRWQDDLIIILLILGVSGGCSETCENVEWPYDGLDNDCDPDTPDDDLDGDGYGRDQDCDDLAAEHWDSVTRDGFYFLFQEEIDPWCESACPVDVEGNLVFGDSTDSRVGPYSLEPLACLRSVSGDVRFYEQYAIGSFAGLEQLESVGGTFYVVEQSIHDLRGLDSLRSVRELVLDECYWLESLEGAPALREVEEDLVIRDNARLGPVEIQRLVSSIDVIGDDVEVEGNGGALAEP